MGFINIDGLKLNCQEVETQVFFTLKAFPYF